MQIQWVNAASTYWSHHHNPRNPITWSELYVLMTTFPSLGLLCVAQETKPSVLPARVPSHGNGPADLAWRQVPSWGSQCLHGSAQQFRARGHVQLLSADGSQSQVQEQSVVEEVHYATADCPVLPHHPALDGAVLYDLQLPEIRHHCPGAAESLYVCSVYGLLLQGVCEEEAREGSGGGGGSEGGRGDGDDHHQLIES